MDPLQQDLIRIPARRTSRSTLPAIEPETTVAGPWSRRARLSILEAMSDPGQTIAVVLAAGGGSRFAGDTHKLLAEVDGVAIAATAIRRAIEADIGPVAVVTGPADLAAILATVDAEGDRVTVLDHPGWADGQATSVQVAIRHALEVGAAAVVVGLADQPFVEVGAWRRVAASDAPIAVATYEERRGNPVRLAADVWPLLPTGGDEGARSLTRMRPDLVQEIPCPGSAADIDTLEDLRTWQNRSSTNSP